MYHDIKDIKKSNHLGVAMTTKDYLLKEFSVYDLDVHVEVLVRKIMSVHGCGGTCLFSMDGEPNHLQNWNIGHYLRMFSATQFGKYNKTDILNKNFVKGYHIADRNLFAVMTNGTEIKVSVDEHVRFEMDMKPFFAARLRREKLNE